MDKFYPEKVALQNGIRENQNKKIKEGKVLCKRGLTIEKRKK